MSGNEHRIPKETVRVRLRVRGGAEWDGDLFLDACSPFYPGPQRLIDFLNQPTNFFPVRMADGGVRIVGKNELIFVSLPPEAEERFGVPARFASRAAVGVELVEGATLDGEIDLHEAQVALPRAIDALNGPKPFLWFRSGETQCAVSKEAIRWVIPSDAMAKDVAASEALSHV